MGQRELQIVHGLCAACGGQFMVAVWPEDMVRWRDGELAQNAFPYLNATDREKLISRLCEECQEQVFG